MSGCSNKQQLYLLRSWKALEHIDSSSNISPACTFLNASYNCNRMEELLVFFFFFFFKLLIKLHQINPKIKIRPFHWLEKIVTFHLFNYNCLRNFNFIIFGVFWKVSSIAWEGAWVTDVFLAVKIADWARFSEQTRVHGGNILNVGWSSRSLSFRDTHIIQDNEISSIPLELRSK